jgi:hypothetical protein
VASEQGPNQSFGCLSCDGRFSDPILKKKKKKQKQTRKPEHNYSSQHRSNKQK